MIGVNVCGASSSTLLIHVMESWIFKHILMIGVK
jgi:hypothetical protein